MKPNHKCDPARMALLYIRQQFICTTFKFDAYENYIEFKKNEVISLNNIEDVQFYDNVKFEIVANGYRWGNDDYYSGDANVNIKKGEKTLKYIYKGKVYINANNKSYIVLNEKGTTKFYVFNLGTKKKTKQMYYELLEHVH